MKHAVAKKVIINLIHQLYFDARAIDSIIERVKIFRDSALPISEHLYVLRQISRTVIRMSWSRNSIIHYSSNSVPWSTLVNIETLDSETLSEYLAALKKDNNLDVLIEKLIRCVSYSEKQIVIKKQQYEVLVAISDNHEKISIPTQRLKESLDAAEQSIVEEEKKLNKSKKARTEEQQKAILKTKQMLHTLRDIYSHMDLLMQSLSQSEPSESTPMLALQVLALLNPATIAILKEAVSPPILEDIAGSLLTLLNSSNFFNSIMFQDSWLAPLIDSLRITLALPLPRALDAFFAGQHEFEVVYLFAHSNGLMPGKEAITQILHRLHKSLKALVKGEEEQRAQLFKGLKLLELLIKGLRTTTPEEEALREKVVDLRSSILLIADGNLANANSLIAQIKEFFVSEHEEALSEDNQKDTASDKENSENDESERYLRDIAMLKIYIKNFAQLSYSDLNKYKSTQINIERIRKLYKASPLSMDKRAALDKLLNSTTEINVVMQTLKESAIPEPLFFNIITVVKEGRINNASLDDDGDIIINGEITSLKQLVTHVMNKANWAKDYDPFLARKAQKSFKDNSLPDITVKSFQVRVKERQDYLAEEQKKAAEILVADAASAPQEPGHFVVLKENVLLSTIEALTPTLLAWKARLCEPFDSSAAPEEILRRAYHKKLMELAFRLINQVCFPGALDEHEDLVVIHRLAILRVTSVLGEIFHEMRGAPYCNYEPDIKKVNEWRNILQHFAPFKNSIAILSSYLKDGWVKKQENLLAPNAGNEDREDNPSVLIEKILTVLQHDVFNNERFEHLSDESNRLLGLAREYLLTFAGGDLIRDLSLSARFLEFSTLTIHTRNQLGILTAPNIAKELQLTRNRYAHAPLISSINEPSSDKALMLRMFELVKTVRSIEPVKSSDLDLVQNLAIPAMQLCWVILMLTDKDGSLREDLEGWVQKDIERFARMLNITLNNDQDPVALLLLVERRINQLVMQYGDPALQEILNFPVEQEHGKTPLPNTRIDSASTGAKRFGLFSHYYRAVYAERNNQWHQLQLPEVQGKRI